MKPATIDQLLQTIAAYNAAHANHLKYPAEVRGQKNPMLENLYMAAANASEALIPLVKVTLKTTSAK